MSGGQFRSSLQLTEIRIRWLSNLSHSRPRRTNVLWVSGLHHKQPNRARVVRGVHSRQDVSLLDQNTQEFYRQHWAQTLMFPGTICENSKITVEKSDLRSQLDTLLDLPLTIVGLVLIFLLLISLLLALFILCYCYYSRRKYSSKHKLL